MRTNVYAVAHVHAHAHAYPILLLVIAVIVPTIIADVNTPEDRPSPTTAAVAAAVAGLENNASLPTISTSSSSTSSFHSGLSTVLTYTNTSTSDVSTTSPGSSSSDLQLSTTASAQIISSSSPSSLSSSILSSSPSSSSSLSSSSISPPSLLTSPPSSASPTLSSSLLISLPITVFSSSISPFNSNPTLAYSSSPNSTYLLPTSSSLPLSSLQNSSASSSSSPLSPLQQSSASSPPASPLSVNSTYTLLLPTPSPSLLPSQLSPPAPYSTGHLPSRLPGSSGLRYSVSGGSNGFPSRTISTNNSYESRSGSRSEPKQTFLPSGQVSTESSSFRQQISGRPFGTGTSPYRSFASGSGTIKQSNMTLVATGRGPTAVSGRFSNSANATSTTNVRACPSSPGENNAANLTSTDTTKPIPTPGIGGCCGKCYIRGPNVDVYYWPEPGSDTECLSVIGNTVNHPRAGATTTCYNNGCVTYWAQDWCCQTGTWSPHYFQTVATWTTINGIAFKNSWLNPWETFSNFPGLTLVGPMPSTPAVTPAPQTALSSNSIALPVTPRMIEPQGQLNLSKNASQGGQDSIVVVDGHTFTSPSVYVNFYQLSATDDCGLLGPQVKSTMVAFAPGELSSIAGPGPGPVSNFIIPANGGPIETPVYPVSSYNFADLPCPPTSVMSEHWWKPEEGEPYRPMIAFPDKIRSIDPSWANCDAGLFIGLDPPVVLTPAQNLLTPQTTPGAPAQSPAPAQGFHTLMPVAKTAADDLIPTPTPIPTYEHIRSKMIKPPQFKTKGPESDPSPGTGSNTDLPAQPGSDQGNNGDPAASNGGVPGNGGDQGSVGGGSDFKGNPAGSQGKSGDLVPGGGSGQGNNGNPAAGSSNGQGTNSGSPAGSDPKSNPSISGSGQNSGGGGQGTKSNPAAGSDPNNNSPAPGSGQIPGTGSTNNNIPSVGGNPATPNEAQTGSNGNPGAFNQPNPNGQVQAISSLADAFSKASVPVLPSSQVSSIIGVDAYKALVHPPAGDLSAGGNPPGPGSAGSNSPASNAQGSQIPPNNVAAAILSQEASFVQAASGPGTPAHNSAIASIISSMGQVLNDKGSSQASPSSNTASSGSSSGGSSSGSIIDPAQVQALQDLVDQAGQAGSNGAPSLSSEEVSRLRTALARAAALTPGEGTSSAAANNPGSAIHVPQAISNPEAQILSSIVAQAGNPQATGSGVSPLPASQVSALLSVIGSLATPPAVMTSGSTDPNHFSIPLAVGMSQAQVQAQAQVISSAISAAQLPSSEAAALNSIIASVTAAANGPGVTAPPTAAQEIGSISAALSAQGYSSLPPALVSVLSSALALPAVADQGQIQSQALVSAISAAHLPSSEASALNSIIASVTAAANTPGATAPPDVAQEIQKISSALSSQGYGALPAPLLSAVGSALALPSMTGQAQLQSQAIVSAIAAAHLPYQEVAALNSIIASVTAAANGPGATASPNVADEMQKINAALSAQGYGPLPANVVSALSSALALPTSQSYLAPFTSYWSLDQEREQMHQIIQNAVNSGVITPQEGQAMEAIADAAINVKKEAILLAANGNLNATGIARPTHQHVLGNVTAGPVTLPSLSIVQITSPSSSSSSSSSPTTSPSSSTASTSTSTSTTATATTLAPAKSTGKKSGGVSVSVSLNPFSSLYRILGKHVFGKRARAGR